MDTLCGLFAHNDRDQPFAVTLRESTLGRRARLFLAVIRSCRSRTLYVFTEEDEPGLLFLLFFFLVGFLLVAEQDVGRVFLVPGKPRTVEVVLLVLSTFLNGDGELVEENSQVGVDRIGQGRDHEFQLRGLRSQVYCSWRIAFIAIL